MGSVGNGAPHRSGEASWLLLVVMAARALGLTSLDGIFNDVVDSAGPPRRSAQSEENTE